MADGAITLQLQVLQRQYLQLVEPHQLRWPVDAVLKQPNVQAWMYHEMFDMENIKSPPPDRYQLRVLKMLVAKLERAIEDPEEDVGLPISSMESKCNCSLSTVSNCKDLTILLNPPRPTLTYTPLCAGNLR
jgi:hypothetical protein